MLLASSADVRFWSGHFGDKPNVRRFLDRHRSEQLEIIEGIDQDPAPALPIQCVPVFDHGRSRR
jgi:hypothetical protein